MSQRNRAEGVPKTAPFTKWLLTQVGRTDKVGQLANDVLNDPYWPGDTDVMEYQVYYLGTVGVSQNYLDNAYRAARKEWCLERELTIKRDIQNEPGNI